MPLKKEEEVTEHQCKGQKNLRKGGSKLQGTIKSNGRAQSNVFI